MERRGPSSSLIRWTAEDGERWEQTVRRNFAFRWYMFGWPIFRVMLQNKIRPGQESLSLFFIDSVRSDKASCKLTLLRRQDRSSQTIKDGNFGDKGRPGVQQRYTWGRFWFSMRFQFLLVFAVPSFLKNASKKTYILHYIHFSVLYVQQRDCCPSYLPQEAVSFSACKQSYPDLAVSKPRGREIFRIFRNCFPSCPGSTTIRNCNWEVWQNSWSDGWACTLLFNIVGICCWDDLFRMRHPLEKQSAHGRGGKAFADTNPRGVLGADQSVVG